MNDKTIILLESDLDPDMFRVSINGKKIMEGNSGDLDFHSVLSAVTKALGFKFEEREYVSDD